MFKFWGIMAASMPVPSSILDASTNPVAKFLGWNQPGSGSDVIQFYQSWAQYLDAKALVWIKVIGGFCAGLGKMLYGVAHAVESVFYHLFNLFDILKISEITGNGRFAKLHLVLLLIACALLLISLAMIFISMMMGNRKALHEMATAIFTGLIVIIMLPAAVGWLGSFGQAAVKDLNTSGTSKNEQVTSIALEPFKANTIDMLELANDVFNTDPDKVGGDAGMAKYNHLTDKTLNSTQFTDVIAGDNIDALKDKKDGNVFKYRIQDGVSDNGKPTKNLVELNFPEKQFKITQAMDSVYPRFVVNWWLVDLEEIALTFIFTLMAIKVGKSIFEIIMLTLAAPLVALGNLRSSKQIKTLIMTMVGGVMGIVMEVVSVKLFLIVVNYLPQSSVLSGLGGGWAKGLATLVVYASTFIAMFTGVSFVERWLGTASGTNQEGRHMMSGFLAAKTASHAVGALAGGIKTGGQQMAGKIKTALSSQGDAPDDNGSKMPSVLNTDNQDGDSGNSTKDDQGIMGAGNNGADGDHGEAGSGGGFSTLSTTQADMSSDDSNDAGSMPEQAGMGAPMAGDQLTDQAMVDASATEGVNSETAALAGNDGRISDTDQADAADGANTAVGDPDVTAVDDDTATNLDEQSLASTEEPTGGVLGDNNAENGQFGNPELTYDANGQVIDPSGDPATGQSTALTEDPTNASVLGDNNAVDGLDTAGSEPLDTAATNSRSDGLAEIDHSGNAMANQAPGDSGGNSVTNVLHQSGSSTMGGRTANRGLSPSNGAQTHSVYNRGGVNRAGTGIKPHRGQPTVTNQGSRPTESGTDKLKMADQSTPFSGAHQRLKDLGDIDK
ncbi:pLS20_p028 family conjugation system transmembrane protein [Secundilactobacillus kimchicus]|uniref:pLS20_p028 family conjugation system transmembrane protein n=1 Tax=Secundilactobacillus kimchicus TaxID=528209 RepID=UPI0024A89303|nr:hypothetical protein [Secundilactobacillus kimchicus]